MVMLSAQVLSIKACGTDNSNRTNAAVARAFGLPLVAMSSSRTFCPALAMWAAIPAPIVPAPMTAMVVKSGGLVAGILSGTPVGFRGCLPYFVMGVKIVISC